MLAYCRVRSVFPFILFHYIPSLTPQRQPHARAVIHSLIAFHSTHFTFRVYVFSHPQIHVVAAVFRFTPHRFTTAHIHPFRSFAPIHSIRSLLPALAFSNAPFGQKNAPNQLPAAPVHRAPRFLCPGHSLHSQRLAHNAQAEYFVSFLFTRISALLSTHAQGCFYLFRFKSCFAHANPRPPTPKYPLNSHIKKDVVQYEKK